MNRRKILFIKQMKKLNFTLTIFFLLTFLAANAQTSSGSVQEEILEGFNCSQAGQVVCDNGQTAFCDDSLYSTICFNLLTPAFPNGFPDCCREINNPAGRLECDATLLRCPGTPTNSETEVSTLVAGPEFPEIVSFPTTPDLLDIGTNFAFVGSNPTFELRVSEIKEDVISVDVTDGMGIKHTNIPFRITEVATDDEKILLSLFLPENINTGEAAFTINLDENKAITGKFDVIDFLNISIPIGNSINKTKPVSEPEIERATANGKKRSLRLNISGNNFIGNKVFTEDSEFIENDKTEPHTTLTVLPSNFLFRVDTIMVSKDGMTLDALVRFPELLPNNMIHIVAIVSTPRGTSSITVPVSLNKSKASITLSEIDCMGERPICPNGKRAKCTGGGYEAVCPTPIFKMPDCCKEAEFDLFSDCEPTRLVCPE